MDQDLFQAVSQSNYDQKLATVREYVRQSESRSASVCALEALRHCLEVKDIRLTEFWRTAVKEIEHHFHRPGRGVTNGTHLVVESWQDKPQAYFFIKYGNGQTLLGRKRISDQWINDDIGEIHGNQMNLDMILGWLLDFRTTESDIMFYFLPIEGAEKDEQWSRMKNDPSAEITFPFPSLSSRNKEIRCNDAGWHCSIPHMMKIDNGEKTLRQLAVNYLKNMDLKDKVIFDPACDSGEFLWAIKQAFPECRTIGQDLSSSMVDVAKHRMDECICGDARETPLPDESVDVMVCRFLNSEVVSTADAHDIFIKIESKVRNGGKIFIVGHTPVLLSGQFFSLCGLEVEGRIGFCDQDKTFCQFYVLNKFQN